MTGVQRGEGDAHVATTEQVEQWNDELTKIDWSAKKNQLKRGGQKQKGFYT